jgi:hypothetical protein
VFVAVGPCACRVAVEPSALRRAIPVLVAAMRRSRGPARLPDVDEGRDDLCRGAPTERTEYCWYYCDELLPRGTRPAWSPRN